jgi:ketosteroid isomerase-like protein
MDVASPAVAHLALGGDKVVVYLHAWVRLKGVVDRTGGRFANGVVFRNGKITEYRSFAERMQALDRAGIQDRS